MVPSVTFREFTPPTTNSQPSAITSGPDGNLWSTETAANRIAQTTPFGQVSEFFIPTSASGPAGITSGHDGNLWFTEQTANKIGRISTAGFFTEFMIPTAASGALGITIGPDNNLWFTEQTVNQIGRITPTGTISEFPILALNGSPRGITAGPDGNVWFTEVIAGGASQIGRITPQGLVTLFPISIANSAPGGITTGPDGNLWFTDAGTVQIGRITTTGTVTEFPIPSNPDVPLAITAGPDGNLWYTRGNAASGFTGSDRIGRITSGGIVAEFALPSSNSNPVSITSSLNGNLWLAEKNTGKIAEAVLSHYIVTGADSGGTPQVNVYSAFTGALKSTFEAYALAFRGGVRVAVGDVTGDGVPDIITGAGPGGGPHVRVFDGVTLTQLPTAIGSFFPFPLDFTGGVNVASGDFDGDGRADVVCAADTGGSPDVRIYSGADGHLIREFFPYNIAFTGGVRVAVGDVNGDGVPDIIVGAGPGGGPQVLVINGKDFSVYQSLFPYNPGFTGGVYVAAGDIDHDGKADIITGAGAGGGPHVEAFSGVDLRRLQSFFAYNLAFTGGVRVGAVDINEDGVDDFLTAAGPGGGPHVQAFDGTSLAAIENFFAYGQFAGGVFVGGG